MDIDDKLKENIKEEMSLLRVETREVIENFKFKDIFIEIGNKYRLSESEKKTLEVETILVLLGLVNSEILSQNIEHNIGTSEEEAGKIANDIVEKIFNPISQKVIEKIKESIKNSDASEDVPLPPYSKKIQAPPSTLPIASEEDIQEEKILEKSDINVIPETKVENKSIDEKKFSMSEDRVLVDSGIDMLEEKPRIEKEHFLPNTETQRSVLSGVEHPPAGVSSILGQKLGGSMSQAQKTSTYSSADTIPTPSPNSTPPLPPQTSKDPYRENL